MVPRLHGITEARERRARRLPYAELLDRLEAGPPPWSPTGLPGAGYELGNLHEFFVHHEDVRRPQDPTPRRLDAALEDALWRRTRLLAPLFAARARGLLLRLEATDGRVVEVRRGSRPAVVSGTVGELFLWLWGRRDAARVVVSGDGVDLLSRVHP
ncbi:MAG: maleylpyruvate isomerase family mycothiol-dependent enzyme [Jatrophihabitans sp.]|uniref:maleylpyruvate isomerase family mycothiol-dependent enzyme n=1 Tax=Jatrophihabitans sp. TaxID=1932789 RepID=UPI003F800C9C